MSLDHEEIKGLYACLKPRIKPDSGIQQLSELHSQQIALLGYIQIEDIKWYIEDKSMTYYDLIPPCGKGQKIVVNHQKSIYYYLTTDQSKALRNPKP